MKYDFIVLVDFSILLLLYLIHSLNFSLKSLNIPVLKLGRQRSTVTKRGGLKLFGQKIGSEIFF